MQTTDPPTERRHPGTADIDLSSSEEIVRILLREDAVAVRAAQSASSAIAEAVDGALARTRVGGSVHYFGAGASGRLALLDATEATPTFGAPHGFFVPHFPGGAPAVLDSDIDLEDADELGYNDAGRITQADVVVGISASGTTAYVHGAMRRSRESGALVIVITCNPESTIASMADAVIVADTGPEALTGSTRLKAGTATKVILNAFSTALMVRSGKTYSNLMVDLVATNRKLRSRALSVLQMSTSHSRQECETALDECDGELPTALVRMSTGCSPAASRDALHRGSVRHAIESLS